VFGAVSECVNVTSGDGDIVFGAVSECVNVTSGERRLCLELFQSVLM